MNAPDDMGPSARGSGRQIPEPERREERLAGLLILGLALLNLPILSIFGGTAFVAGIPILYLYLFSAWSLIIGIAAFVLRGRSSESRSPSEGPDFTDS
jgi:hypothetical protein